MVLNSLPDAKECDETQIIETNQLLNNLFLNILMAIVLMLIFEGSRHIKSIYMKRVTKDKFVKGGRVPEVPPSHIFGWLKTMYETTEEDILHMVGLDGYMLLRYIHVCGRICAFIAFWGLLVLVPFYGNSGGKECAWNRFTLGNVPPGEIDQVTFSRLWVPAIFAYMFSAFFCFVMYSEYYNFLEKRVRYLRLGDPDTPPQAYYTVMVEKVPTSLRSAQAMADFFDNLFPGEVYSIQLACDLSQLDALVAERKTVRDRLEKAIAINEATGSRPTMWLAIDEVEAFGPDLKPLEDREVSWVTALGFKVVDSIDYYSRMLQELNESVLAMQAQFLKEETNVILPQHKPGTRSDAIRLVEIDGAAAAAGQGQGPRDRRPSKMSMEDLEAANAARLLHPQSPSRARVSDVIEKENGVELLVTYTDGSENPESKHSPGAGAEPSSRMEDMLEGDNPEDTVNDREPDMSQKYYYHARDRDSVAGAGGGAGSDSGRGVGSSRVSMTQLERQQTKRSFENLEFLQSLPGPVEGVVNESLKTVETAAKGAIRGVLEATRTLELLTVGAYYKTSSTAFVTLRSRVASSNCDQMQLSHRHYTMTVRSAPNPKDIRWENVMIPQRQIDMRRTIADITLTIGALFWSLVLGFITQISSLETMSREYSWLQAYSGTFIYSVFNSYLTSGMLLALLSVLPLIFDMIARNYEGLKLESEIQNSIMTRYFYYQLANVFVSVYAGSIITALHQIFDSPSSLLSILGSTLPSFSIYFANLVIVKTFTAVPIEMLRLWPLAQIMTLKLCMNKKKWTWRELQAGAFKDPPMLYGWIYPSLMMVLMIVTTYACIAPFISPLGVIFYSFSYVTYKYQLLFVFINHYQSGGFMWYALFTRSMIALICAAVTLTCYLGFRRTIYYGPFYATLPLPFIILTFWVHCEDKFKNSSYHLSLESAIDLDRDTYEKRMKGFPPHNSFKPKLFRQPSLAEGPLRPGPYRPTVIIPGGKSAFKSAKKNNAFPGAEGSSGVEMSTMGGAGQPSGGLVSNLLSRFIGANGSTSRYNYQPINGDDAVQSEASSAAGSPPSGSGPISNGNGDYDERFPTLSDHHNSDWHDVEASAGGNMDGEGRLSASTSVTSSSYTSDAHAMEDMQDFISNTYEVNLSSQHAGHMHVQEVADILEFPLSPKSDMQAQNSRRRNLSPQRVMGSRQRRVQEQQQHQGLGISPVNQGGAGSRSNPQLHSMGVIQPSARPGVQGEERDGNIEAAGESTSLRQFDPGASSGSYGSTDKV